MYAKFHACLPRKYLDVGGAIRLQSRSKWRCKCLRLNGVSRMLRYSTIAGLVLAAGLATAQSELPRVLVIATGGTIAGEQGEPGTLGGYDIKKASTKWWRWCPRSRNMRRSRPSSFPMCRVPTLVLT